METSHPGNCDHQDEQSFLRGRSLLSQNNDAATPPESRSASTDEEAGTPPSHRERSQLTPRTVSMVMLTALALLGTLYLLWELREIIRWSAVAIFLAVALNPAVDWLDRRRLPRALAILLVYLVLLLFIVGVGALLLPPLVEQSQALTSFVIDLIREPQGPSQQALQDLADRYNLGSFLDVLRAQLSSLPERLLDATTQLFSVTRSVVGGVVSLLSILLLTFFLLLDGKRFVEAGLAHFTSSQQLRVRRLLDRSAAAVSGYITGNLVISLIAGVAAYIVLKIVGVSYALTLALVIAVFDLIPLIGATIGALIVTIVGFFVSPVTGVILLVYFVVYQQLENNVLQPLVYGRQVHLHPIVVFLAAVAGAELLGILGALLAIPVAEIIRILGAEWLAFRAESKKKPPS
ncbi:MAG: AI-2E family transporter [Actinomycetota bacterium]|nr:AI-2E family transporter [Actinomycetota bacterium]